MKTVISHMGLNELKTKSVINEPKPRYKIIKKKKLHIDTNNSKHKMFKSSIVLPPIRTEVDLPKKKEIYSILKIDRNKMKKEDSKKSIHRNHLESKKIETIDNIKENDIIISDNEKDNEEFEEIVDYLNQLDFEKYKRDNDIREALQLIKSKMEKEKKEEEKTIEPKPNKEIKKEKEFTYDELIDKIETENKKEKFKDEIFTDLQELSKEKEDNDTLKFKIAEKISKYDPLLSQVHSYKSIQMLFERFGLSDNIDYDLVNKNIEKEKEKKYIPNLLPYLYTTPILK